MFYEFKQIEEHEKEEIENKLNNIFVINEQTLEILVNAMGFPDHKVRKALKDAAENDRRKSGRDCYPQEQSRDN